MSKKDRTLEGFRNELLEKINSIDPSEDQIIKNLEQKSTDLMKQITSLQTQNTATTMDEKNDQNFKTKVVENKKAIKNLELQIKEIDDKLDKMRSEIIKKKQNDYISDFDEKVQKHLEGKMDEIKSITDENTKKEASRRLSNNWDTFHKDMKDIEQIIQKKLNLKEVKEKLLPLEKYNEKVKKITGPQSNLFMEEIVLKF